MSEEECLEIVKKLDDISQNKFYTINVWDIVSNAYYGDVEYESALTTSKTLLNSFVAADSRIITLRYKFYTNGTYERIRIDHGKVSDILSRLNKIEQQLGM